jgi:serine phosphatase RsbU (regulator of sigma subunit)/ligand-binding sensor domain-containing protein
MFNNRILCLLLSLIFLSSVIIYSQDDYLYENINVADGLSSSSFNPIETIHQDQYGLMWFGTLDGLNMYDGYSFKVFKNLPGDTTSIPSSNILNINEDAEGNLWVITDGFASKFNRLNNTFTHYPLFINSPGNTFAHSLLDSDGQFWVTLMNGGLSKWNKEEDNFEAVKFNLKVEGVDTLVNTESSAASSLLELSNGNLLVATFLNGVFYYNRTTGECDVYSLAGNDAPMGVIDLFEDRSGNIWITGRRHIVEFNPITFNYKEIDAWKKYHPSDDDAFFWGFNELEDGTFFLNSMPLGLSKYDPSQDTFELVDISGDLGKRGVGKLPATKFIDKFGIYWIGLFDNGILKFDPQRRPFRTYKYETEGSSQTNFGITSSIEPNHDKSDEIFLATGEKGIYSFDLKKRELKNLNVGIPNIYTDNSNMGSIVQDDNNKLWFSSSRTKISYYDLISKETRSFEITSVDLATGNAQFINDLEYIPKNKLLISTEFGVIKFNTETYEIEKLNSVGNRMYSNVLMNEIREIAKSINPLTSLLKVGEAASLKEGFEVSERKNLIIVSLGEGLLPQGMFDFGSIVNSNNETIWSMNQYEKTFHANGGYKNRIAIDTISLNPGNYSIQYNTDIGHSYANFNVSPPDDSTWYGIQLFDLPTESFDKIANLVAKEKNTKAYPDYLRSNRILASRKYPNTLWIGGGSKGIYKYDINNGAYERFSREEFDNASTVFDIIFEDSKGTLWLVTRPSGFYRFDSEKKEFYSNISIPDLPQTAINSIIEDFQGNIWIYSSGGIIKLSKSNDGNWATASYDSRDGVPGGFGRGSLVTRSGEILFGSFNGFISFYPSSENTSEPVPVISNITVSDKSIFDPESKIKLTKSIYEESDLTLSFSQNDISFDFSSIHFSRPSKNRVSYKLEGFNNEWKFTDKNFASFTNLDPGEYTFRVKAHSGYGVTSSDERKIIITVNPPWYRTTLAYIFYVFAFAIGIFAIDRIQRRRLLSKERAATVLKEAEFRAQLAESESARKTKELEEARSLQLSMLPKHLPELPNLDIAVYMKTATEVGGDYYDFHVGMDGTLTVVLGDATGHGMKAGTMVTSVKSLFNVLAPNPDIKMTFHEITRCLKLMQMEKLSMCMSMIKISGGNIIMSAAGMPPTFIYKKSDRTIEEHVIKGMPLGTFDNFPYEVKESTLNAGDTILMMSDGFPELMNKEKEIYGYKRARNKFEEVAEGTPEQIIDILKNEGSDWVEGEEPSDDVTFVVIKVK